LNNDDETAGFKIYPLYGKILDHWFPPSEGYDIFPYWNIPDTKKSITFVIEHDLRPLLLVDVKPPSEFKLDSGRDGAIVQVIQHLDAVGPTNLHTDRLYAISAIGKMWRACYTLKGKGSECGQPVNPVAEEGSLRSADRACWSPDVTSDTSWADFESIVKTIKGYVSHVE
jgi:hypothetical protein